LLYWQLLTLVTLVLITEKFNVRNIIPPGPGTMQLLYPPLVGPGCSSRIDIVPRFNRHSATVDRYKATKMIQIKVVIRDYARLETVGTAFHWK